MEYDLLDDELWETIRPLLPAQRRRKTYPGRLPLDDRRVLTGILFVLRTGIRWDRLPADMGCGSGITCWRRWRQWQELGVWAELHKVLLSRLHGVERLNYVRSVGGKRALRVQHDQSVNLNAIELGIARPPVGCEYQA